MIIGAGVRANPKDFLLFEKLLNVVHGWCPEPESASTRSRLILWTQFDVGHNRIARPAPLGSHGRLSRSPRGRQPIWPEQVDRPAFALPHPDGGDRESAEEGRGKPSDTRATSVDRGSLCCPGSPQTSARRTQAKLTTCGSIMADACRKAHNVALGRRGALVRIQSPRPLSEFIGHI